MFYFRYGRCLGMDTRIFYDFSSNAIRDLHADDGSELSNLSGDDMALYDTNYFKVFATDLRDEISRSRHKQRIVIPDSDNSIDSNAEDVPLSLLRKKQEEEIALYICLEILRVVCKF